MNISDGFPEPPEASSVLFTRFDFLFTLLRVCIMQRESNNCTGLFVLLCFFFWLEESLARLDVYTLTSGLFHECFHKRA